MITLLYFAVTIIAIFLTILDSCGQRALQRADYQPLVID